MSFIADQQTLGDLNIPGKFRPGSIFSLFNKVRTAGGEKVLEAMFNSPLSDDREVNQRSGVFRYFQLKRLSFPFDPGQIEAMSAYLEGHAGTTVVSTAISHLRKLALEYVVKDEQYAAVRNGLQSTIAVIARCHEFFGPLAQDSDNPYLPRVHLVRSIVEDKRLSRLAGGKAAGRLPVTHLIRYDHLLRHTLREELAALLQILYDLDVSIAVAHVGAAHGFSYAHALP